MKYNEQNYQVIQSEYNFNTQIWTLHIPNNIVGLNEALQKINKAKKQLQVGVREDELFIKEQENIQLIINFLTHNYVASTYKYITATELRHQFTQYYHNFVLSASKFGALMSLIINNPDINPFNIKRKKKRTGNVYFGLKLI
jgi:hypothetical protein